MPLEGISMLAAVTVTPGAGAEATANWPQHADSTPKKAAKRKALMARPPSEN
jgi:hypothetical protein